MNHDYIERLKEKLWETLSSPENDWHFNHLLKEISRLQATIPRISGKRLSAAVDDMKGICQQIAHAETGHDLIFQSRIAATRLLEIVRKKMAEEECDSNEVLQALQDFDSTLVGTDRYLTEISKLKIQIYRRKWPHHNVPARLHGARDLSSWLLHRYLVGKPAYCFKRSLFKLCGVIFRSKLL